MARFLFTTQISNDLGLLTRSLPVARELAGRGHQVAFCNPARSPDKLIAEAGFENLIPPHPLYFLNHLSATGNLNPRGLYRAIRSGDLADRFGSTKAFMIRCLRALPLHFAPATTEVWSADHLFAMAGMSNANTVRAECAALAETMTEFRADVIVDSMHPLACLAARTLQIPVVALIQADMHPASRGFIWWREPPAHLPTIKPALNKVLAEYGLPQIQKTEELLAGDLALILGTPETDPLPPGAAGTYVGPILWQKSDAVMPAWFDNLDRDRPVVWVYSGNPRYFAFSSPFDSALLLRACRAALADEDLQVVLTTGHHPLPRDLLPLPANFRHEPFLPGLTLARRSSLMIHHGGYGSCQTGLSVGTPAVIVPTYSERESNARRVAAAGAGEFILPEQGARGKRSISADELRVKSRQVLADPAYASQARHVSDRMRSYGGAVEAAEHIERFAKH